MESRLAREVYDGWLADGLTPTLEMCLDINAAGLAVEQTPTASSFYSVPRVAYLGDYIFREPTVRRLAYLEDLRALLDDDTETQFIAAAYVCHVPEAELVPLTKSRRRVKKAVAKFAVEVLGDFSLTQAAAAVGYVLADLDPNALIGDYGEGGGASASPAEVPAHCESYARRLLADAVGRGFDAESAGTLTRAALERVLSAAAMSEGDIKRRDADAVGRFWRVAGKCRARMLDEKARREAKEKEGEA